MINRELIPIRNMANCKMYIFAALMISYRAMASSLAYSHLPVLRKGLQEMGKAMLPPRSKLPDKEPLACLSITSNEISLSLVSFARNLTDFLTDSISEALCSSKSLPHFASGIIAGGIECIVGHPLDTIRVMIISDKTIQVIPTVMITMSSLGGIVSLYRGSLSEILSSAIAGSVDFGSNDFIKRLLRTSNREEDGKESTALDSTLLISAFCSGFLDGITSKPFEMIKLRQQFQYSSPELSFLSSAAALFREGGYAGFFRGWLPTVMRESLGNMAFFASYQFVKNTMTGSANDYSGPMRKPVHRNLVFLVAGAAAGAAYVVTSQPFETASVLMQVDTPLITEIGKAVQGSYKYSGMAQCVRHIIKNGGPRELYRGFIPTLARAIPSYAASFWGYEAVLGGLEEVQLKMAKKRREKKRNKSTVAYSC